MLDSNFPNPESQDARFDANRVFCAPTNMWEKRADAGKRNNDIILFPFTYTI